MAEQLTVERLVGRNVSDLRRALDWSQDRLGSELEKRRYMRKALSRKAVSVLENGHRRLVVEEIITLALVLGVPVARLFQPHVGEEITLSTGKTAPARDLVGAGDLADEEKAARYYALSGIASTARMARDEIRSARRSLEAADRWATALQEIPEEEH